MKISMFSTSAVTGKKVSKEAFLASQKSLELLEKKFRGIFNKLNAANAESFKKDNEEIQQTVVDDSKLLRKLLDKFQE
jgi:hypothetical protein